MRITIFGLSVSSSWGNGHAALWRGLIGALLELGHQVTFFEQDTTYYAGNRDLHTLPPGGRLVIYRTWADVIQTARAAVENSDVGVVTSYCPNALDAEELLACSRIPLRCFYDLDTPVTLARLAAGETVAYIGPRGLRDYDLVLSFTGGGALHALQRQLGAICVLPLYGSVDPTVHSPLPRPTLPATALSYMGTYAPDRQAKLEQLFLEPARILQHDRFVIAGAQYPPDFPWRPNIHFLRHLPPGEHAAFYASSRLTLNITRADMAAFGWCPSGRLFEAAACGTPILTDEWPGLDSFFEPGREILVASSTTDVLTAVARSPPELGALARLARERVLDQHTATHRAIQMVAAFADGPGQTTDGVEHVGSHSGSRPGHADAAAGVF